MLNLTTHIKGHEGHNLLQHNNLFLKNYEIFTPNSAKFQSDNCIYEVDNFTYMRKREIGSK